MKWIGRPSLDGNPNRKQYLGLSENELTSVLHMNEVFSNIILTRVPVIHWGMIILKVDDSAATSPLELLFLFNKGGNFREPTYREKLEYLEYVGIWKQVALEVMPRKQDIVDKADVYHMFEFPRSDQFRFDIRPIFRAPDCYQITEDGKYEYFIKKSDDAVEYLYLRNKNGELRWREKQNLKDKLLGEDRYAVELIIKGMENKEYTALICLPKWWQPDFTLTKP